MIPITSRQRRLLRLLWQEEGPSRWELHEKTGINATAVGADIAALLDMGIVRECRRTAERPGRLRMPLEIDDATRQVVGLAIRPGQVESVKLNLRGRVVEQFVWHNVDDATAAVGLAQTQLQGLLDERVLAIGVSATGFVDTTGQSIGFSSILGGAGSTSLEPLFIVAANRPLVLENDMHALAARWLLTHQAESDEDVLLVRIDDAQLGAALLIGGHPNRGCAIGANELGHTRFFIETDPCYCGHTGCLERICSSEFLRRLDASTPPLLQRASGFDGSDPALATIIDYLSMGVANAVNLIRPNRLVLVSELTRYRAFNDALMQRIRWRLLAVLLQQVRIDQWSQPAAHGAETAGWLALAGLYREGWNRSRRQELSGRRQYLGQK